MHVRNLPGIVVVPLSCSADVRYITNNFITEMRTLAPHRECFITRLRFSFSLELASPSFSIYVIDEISDHAMATLSKYALYSVNHSV